MVSRLGRPANLYHADAADASPVDDEAAAAAAAAAADRTDGVDCIADGEGCDASPGGRQCCQGLRCHGPPSDMKCIRDQ